MAVNDTHESYNILFPGHVCFWCFEMFCLKVRQTMLNQNPVADHHFITQVFAIWGIFGIDVPPIDFLARFRWPILACSPRRSSASAARRKKSDTGIYDTYIYIMLNIYIHMYICIMCIYIYIYISHKALFVAFCFYPLDIVWCFFLVRGSEISAYGAFECKTKAFHCLWAVCSCCTSFNQLEPWVGAEVHLIAEEQLGEGAANPRKKGLRDSHLLRISYVIIFFLCLPAEHLCCPRIHGMMRSMWFLWRCGSLFCACH